MIILKFKCLSITGLIVSEKTKLSDTLNRHNSLKVNYLLKLKLTLKLVLPLT